MEIPREFKGKIYIYWNVKHNFFFFTEREEKSDGEYLRLGSTDDLHITFDRDDVTAQAVEALDQQIEQTRSEMMHRIEVLKGRKASLLALEVQS